MSAFSACEGCPFFEPPPECSVDDDCEGEEETCENGLCLSPGEPDAGALDAGAVDAGTVDAGDTDAGFFDAGDVDAGTADAGDAGEADAGEEDAGEEDAGEEDAGDVDAGDEDAGPADLTCSSSRDCDFDRRCAELRDEGDDVVAHCRAKGLGVSVLGDLCAASSTCESGLCLPRAGVCSEACDDAALDCATDSVCTAYPFGATNGFTFVSVCALQCAADADCPSSRVCTYNGNPVTNVFDSVCEETAGVGTLGQACTVASDCESALCLTEGCSRACDVDNDCIGGEVGNPMPTCTDVIVSDPNDTGATATLRMCR